MLIGAFITARTTKCKKLPAARSFSGCIQKVATSEGGHLYRLPITLSLRMLPRSNPAACNADSPPPAVCLPAAARQVLKTADALDAEPCLSRAHDVLVALEDFAKAASPAVILLLEQKSHSSVQHLITSLEGAVSPDAIGAAAELLAANEFGCGCSGDAPPEPTQNHLDTALERLLREAVGPVARNPEVRAYLHALTDF
jgi:hypothetical protein